MNTPHKHAALIKAWADGFDIQCRKNATYDWVDIIGGTPAWSSDWEYRIKPKTIKYRTYLWQNAFGSYGIFTCTYEQNRIYDYEYTRDFIKWLGGWQEVEI